MRTIRWIAWSLVVLVAGLTVAVLVSTDIRDSLLGRPGTGSGVAAIGGAFTMVDHTGKPVSDQDFVGKPSVYFFGFTHCPDVCPTSLYEISTMMEDLGPEADKLNVSFVTVDPERDTAQVMSDYISPFDNRIVGLTGSTEQVADMTKAFRVFSRRVNLDDGDYTMDHTATIYLMDAEGAFAGTIAYGEDTETALGKLRNLIARS